ncbi:MAG TPA: DUF58 domain-containing protein [Leucothrix mucor]|nr:DUF58 domain-containing protein [Leucothrix mucor]
MPLPSTRLFYILAFIAFIGLLASVWPNILSIWKISLYTLGFVAMIDLVLVYLKQPIEAFRDVPSSLPLGVSRRIKLRLHNHSNHSQTLAVYDHYPEEMDIEGLPVKLSIDAGQYADIRYKLVSTERGGFAFPCIQLHLRSLLGLWQRNIILNVHSETRVYPNFAALSQYALLATDNNLSQMGIIKKRRRGEGQDFHQLREYREGDALRQIDWKATSRSMKLISREYQDERDQEIIFMLDCGHRMLAKDDELSHFDHTLNAILLLSFVALRQGDAVGLSTFSGESRWIPPRKGYHTIQNILNTVYDLQPSSESPDFSKAATDLMVRHKKRSLIIVLTNIRDEDSDDLLPAIRLLRKRHLVLVSSLREKIIDDVLHKSIKKLPDAILNAATHQYLQHRKKAFEKLLINGTNAVETTPEHLSVELINAYLNIKRSGVL